MPAISGDPADRPFLVSTEPSLPCSVDGPACLKSSLQARLEIEVAESIMLKGYGMILDRSELPFRTYFPDNFPPQFCFRRVASMINANIDFFFFPVSLDHTCITNLADSGVEKAEGKNDEE